jgi:hypothetical protein
LVCCTDVNDKYEHSSPYSLEGLGKSWTDRSQEKITYLPSKSKHDDRDLVYLRRMALSRKVVAGKVETGGAMKRATQRINSTEPERHAMRPIGLDVGKGDFALAAGHRRC